MRPSPVDIISDELEREIRMRPIAPSQIGNRLWDGFWPEGQAFSQRQVREIRALGLDPATVPTLTVYVGCSNMVVTGIWDRNKPHRAIPCPVIGYRGDQRKIITPNGTAKFVWADGYLTRPKPVRRKTAEIWTL